MREQTLGAKTVRGGRRRRSRAGRIVGAVLALVLVLVAIAAAVGWYQFLRAENAVAAGKPVTVVIPKGTSTSRIATMLVKAGVVPNSNMFRLDSRRADADGTMKAGEYQLATGMPNDVVIAKLQAGPTIKYFDVPIPEGFTARQVAARFAKRADLSEEKMLELVLTRAEQFSDEHPYLKDAHAGSMEGFLFPATYRVKEGTTETAVVEMMLDKFDEEIAKIDLGYAESKNLTVTDVASIASILERETRIAEEFPLVSAVIYNRLKIDMRLQLCATVLYRLPAGTTLTTTHLKNGDPYNTYSHDGLPPGPISNPGARALKAAARPASEKYLYYVLTGKDGSQTFTTSYADFLKAKAVNKRVFGK